jgi:predicted PurR-regulated permease PerM
VLLAALIGASLLGFVGALMAIPAAAAIKLIAQELVIPRAESA